MNIEELYYTRKENSLYNTSYPLIPLDWESYRINEPLMFKSEKVLSLYVHIPFCQQICTFCEYIKMRVSDEEVQLMYISHLRNDVETFLDTHPNINLQGFDVGGGTPTALTEQAFAQLMCLCKHAMNISNVCDDYEPSIEGTFPTITKGKLDMMAGAGFHRLSLGVQSYSSLVTQTTHRLFSSIDEMKKIIHLARQSGIRKINLDFMYGLQNQSLGSLRDALWLIQYLHPEQVTLYELRTNMICEQSHTTSAERYAMYSMLYDGLVAMGYHAPFGQNTFSIGKDDMGVSSYLRHRMRDCTPYKGFGLSAQSMSSCGIAYNLGKKGRHLKELLRKGTYAEEYTYLLPPEEIASKYIAIAAYSGAFSMVKLSEILQKDAESVYERQLEFCFDKGLLQKDGELARITKEGFRHYGAVFSLFYDFKYK